MLNRLRREFVVEEAAKAIPDENSKTLKEELLAQQNQLLWFTLWALLDIRDTLQDLRINGE